MARFTQPVYLRSVSAAPAPPERANIKRNPFCGKYKHCLDQAARLDLSNIDCSRCFFRNDESGRAETRQYLSSYLHLLKVIVHEDRHQTVVRLSPKPDCVRYLE
jgi:hypothetical protein